MDEMLQRLQWFIPILLSLTVHEWAHAYAAYRLGDDTARLQGRLTLNPLAHMDFVGTFLLPLMGVPFGWAKPVPVNPLRFRSSVSIRTGMLIVAAAGPLSNIIIASIAWGLILILRQPAMAEVVESLGAAVILLVILVPINIGLAVFNMIPIPPLDGSKIVDALVPDSMRPGWNRFCEMGPILLIALILLPHLTGFSPVGEVVRFVMRLVTGGFQ